ncbi:MAG TPA: SpoIID/LytB domain-containing protein [Terriglobia bacterium]|nr:SpoIID/LytB domain-containing protein [Terriglobia bacterium]
MAKRTVCGALGAGLMAMLRRRACLIGALWLLSLAPQPARAQEFRVQLSFIPGPESAARRERGRPSPPPRTVTVDLDTYVEGVLAGEASVLRNRAALQAMAVLARTWALRYRGRHRGRGFDFCSLTHCQVFRLPGGTEGQYSPAIIDAVFSTRDEVLEYRGRLADPYFTADCGGVTESSAEVWPDRALPYLRSAPDPYCAGSAHANWQRTISLDYVASILRGELRLPVRGSLRGLSVASRDSSGRARSLEVLAGDRLSIDANQFRYAVGRRLGWDTLKSNLYSVERHGDTLVFSGRGLGHGVGLCQAGADAMAGLGIGYQKILAHYFPGATVAEFAPAPKSEEDPVASSEHFELDYPEAQKPWVSGTLNQLEKWRTVLAERARPVAARTRVLTWNTTAEFIRATGEPGWAAGSSDGQSISLQPLATLAGKRILDSTLRHELTHLTLHRLRAPGVPEWFEEGFVLYLTGERIDNGPSLAAGPRTLGEGVTRAQSAAEMRAAYARSARLVRSLAERRGTKALWQVLEHPSSSDLDWLKKEEAKPLAP